MSGLSRDRFFPKWCCCQEYAVSNHARIVTGQALQTHDTVARDYGVSIHARVVMGQVPSKMMCCCQKYAVSNHAMVVTGQVRSPNDVLLPEVRLFQTTPGLSRDRFLPKWWIAARSSLFQTTPGLSRDRCFPKWCIDARSTLFQTTPGLSQDGVFRLNDIVASDYDV